MERCGQERENIQSLVRIKTSTTNINNIKLEDMGFLGYI